MAQSDANAESHTPRPRRRMKRRETMGSWRFLTFSCYRQLPLLGSARIRDAFAETLRDARSRHRFRLIAWVAMPEHVHLIIVPQPVVTLDRGVPMVASRSTVREILWGIKKPLSQRVITRWTSLDAPILSEIRLADGTHRFWQAGGGFDRNIRSETELLR